MKIIITATSAQMNQPFNPRFGRCDYFILIDSVTREWEALSNPAASASGGAGPQAVQFIADRGAKAAISGRYGPSAASALKAAGIKAYIAENGTVDEVLEKFLAGELESVDTATGPSLHGRGLH